MRRHKRKYIPSRLIIAVLLLVFGMGIGYAALATTLTIDGTSDIDSASWDVHFNNVQVTSGSVSATTPAISNNTTVSFSANLANPGDFYEFTVDVVNAGTLDAKLDAITILPELTATQKNYFNYVVTYLDGVDPRLNDSLAAGVTEKLLIRCDYIKQVDTSLYPTDDMTFNFSVSMTYVQGHGNTRSYVYTGDTNGLDAISIGSPMPSGITTYSTYQAVTTAESRPTFIRHVLINNIVVASFIGVDTGTDVFYLRGGGATQTGNSYNIDSPYFSSNKNILNNLFNEANCSTHPYDYFCSFQSGSNSTGGYLRMDGDIYIETNGCQCRVNPNGTSGCYYWT